MPLGFADQTACLRCHTVIPLGEELRSRRDNFRKVEAERRHADPLWQMVLAARPHLYLRPLLLASIAYMAPFFGIVVGYVFAYRHGQYGLSALLWLWVIGAFHLVSSRLLLRRKPLYVRQLMTAQLGSEPGQPPSCRVCASPLSVPPRTGDSLHSFDCSCDHCGADNIVGDAPLVTPRPDLYSIVSAHQEVFGGVVQQRMDRLYPFILLIGFLALGGLSYVATNAPHIPLAN